MSSDTLRRGDVVEVRSPAAILSTLDERGALDELPFMPEMVAFCGRRFVVDGRAQRICDTVHYSGSRELARSVLLADLRCSGSEHGGCQAECRLFWKEEWLRKVTPESPAAGLFARSDLDALLERTRRHAAQTTFVDGRPEPRWRCQATELPRASVHIKFWDLSSFVKEYLARNVTLRRFLRVTVRAAVKEPMRKLGLIPKVHLPGTRTGPAAADPPLHLRPGELVEVKTKDEIAATLSREGKHRGLWFDREMMPFCGGTFRVRRQRINRFIDDRDGRMIELKNDCVTLEGSVCSGDHSLQRWFCPRAIYPDWRECWLRRPEGARSSRLWRPGLPANDDGGAHGGVGRSVRGSSAIRPTSPAAAVRAPGVHHGVLARNAAHLVLGQVASLALAAVLSAALGRTLGATDFGVYFLLASMSSFAYVFVDWGQSAYLIREAARRPEAIAALLGSALVFRAVTAAAATACTALVAGRWGYSTTVQALGALMVVCSLPLALSQPYAYLFRGRDRMDLDAIVTVAAKAITVAITLPALLLGGRLGAAIVALGLGGAGALATAVLLARRLGLPRPRPTREGVRELALGGASIAVFFAAIAVQPYIDAIVLSKLASGSAVGWYGAARNIMGVLTAPALILAAAAFPQLSRAASHVPELRRAVRMALRPMVGLGTLAAVGLFLFADLAVSLIYGRVRFGPSAAILELFAPMTLLFFVDMLLGSVITAIGRTRVLGLAKLVNVGVSTSLGVLLVPLCQERLGNGGLGMTLAFGISELVMLAAYLSVLPRGALDRGSLLDLGRAVVAGAATVALFRALPPLTPWLAVPGVVAVFALLTLAVGLTRPADLTRLGRRIMQSAGNQPTEVPS